jgi:hypothetical protein
LLHKQIKLVLRNKSKTQLENNRESITHFKNMGILQRVIGGTTAHRRLHENTPNTLAQHSQPHNIEVTMAKTRGKDVCLSHLKYV